MSESEQSAQSVPPTPSLILIRQGTLISRVGMPPSMPPATSYLAGDLITSSSLLALEDAPEDDGSTLNPRYHFTIGRHSYTCPVTHAVLLERSNPKS